MNRWKEVGPILITRQFLVRVSSRDFVDRLLITEKSPEITRTNTKSQPSFRVPEFTDNPPSIFML